MFFFRNFIIISSLAFLMGCDQVETKDETVNSHEYKLENVDSLIANAKKDRIKKSKDQIEIKSWKSVSPYPDVSTESFIGEAKEDSPISIKVIEKMIDHRHNKISVMFRNQKKTGVRSRLYILGYDENARLVYTSNPVLSLRPHEQVINNYNFQKGLGIKKWVFTVR